MKVDIYLKKILDGTVSIKNIFNENIIEGDVNEKLLEDYIGYCIEKKDDYCYDEVFNYIFEESFSDKIVEKMIEKNVGIDELVHKKIKDSVYFMLVEISNEARLIKAKDIYLTNSYSVMQFENFLKNYYLDEIFEELRDLRACTEKKDILLHTTYKLSKDNDIKLDVEKRIIARKLRKETDVNILKKYIKENDYIYYLEIADNVYASKDILEELLKVKNIKFAREIKTRARNTIFKKEKIKDKGNSSDRLTE